MLRTVNRVLLGLTGLVLLLLGLAALLGGLDLQRRWGFSLPSAWPWSGPDEVVLGEEGRTRWRDEGWWWPVAIGLTAVAALLALWWLLAQLRRQRLGEVMVDSGDGEGAAVRGRALEDALVTDAETLEGVDSARVTLSGRPTRPHVRAAVVVAAYAEPAEVLARLREETLERARTSAGLDVLEAEVRLRAARHRPERVS